MAKILCLDIGSGTQDVLLYDSEAALENCAKFILPSPARNIAKRIQELTERKKPVYLHGVNMGGGFGRAVSMHLQAGLGLAAHPNAALSLADDLSRVHDMGVEVVEQRPEAYVAVELGDYSPSFWRAFLELAGLEYPEEQLIAAQDHGFHPGESNRAGRFKLWERFLEESEGAPEKLLFAQAPKELTRLQAVQSTSGGALVSDTGAAAVLGALFMPEFRARCSKRGVVVLNVGNSHCIAFLVYQERIWGVYEHHTGMLSRESLLQDIEAFRKGALGGEQVFESGGHGSKTLALPSGAEEFPEMVVLGPRRTILSEQDGEFIAPGGDMMLAGSFGLLYGHALQNGYEVDLQAGKKQRGGGCGCCAHKKKK